MKTPFHPCSHHGENPAKIAEFEKYMERTLDAPHKDSSDKDKDVPETVGA